MWRNLALAGALIAAMLWPGSDDALAARLDPAFGNGGVLRLPPEDPMQPYLVEERLADGRTLRIERGRMLAFLPSGELDIGFGEKGVATLRVPPGGKAGIQGILIDQLGRLVVVTTWSPDGVEQGRFGAEDTPAEILAERFTATGQPDLTFGGEDGMVLTDFGLPPAEPGLLPSLRLRGNVVFDAEGGILVSGIRTAGVRALKQWGQYRRDTEAFIGRITSTGEADPVFGSNDGGLPMVGFTEAGWLAPLKEGGTFVTYRRGVDMFVARLAGTGLDPDFGEGGLRRVAPGTNAFQPIGLDSGDRLLVSAKDQGSREHHVPNGVALKRLLVDGKLDRSFGRNGLAVFRYPGYYYSGEELDDQDRIVVAMLLRGRNRSGARREEIALARLRANGRIDRSFGREGIFRLPLRFREFTAFGGLTVTGEAATIDFSRCERVCNDFRARVLMDT